MPSAATPPPDAEPLPGAQLYTNAAVISTQAKFAAIKRFFRRFGASFTKNESIAATFAVIDNGVGAVLPIFYPLHT
jgi:hypothetical protein